MFMFCSWQQLAAPSSNANMEAECALCACHELAPVRGLRRAPWETPATCTTACTACASAQPSPALPPPPPPQPSSTSTPAASLLSSPSSPLSPSLPSSTATAAAAAAASSAALAHAHLLAFIDVLDSDPALHEIAFVPGPLHAGLFDGAPDDGAAAEGAAEGGVRTVSLPPLEVALMSGAHRVAIDVKALPPLFAGAHEAWVRARAWLHGRSPSAVQGGGADGGGSEAKGTATMLEKATRALLLLTVGQNYTAWADRRRLLLLRQAEAAAAASRTGTSVDTECGTAGGAAASVAGDTSGVVASLWERELAFCSLVLRSFPKSHESFGHRRWLLARLAAATASDSNSSSSSSDGGSTDGGGSGGGARTGGSVTVGNTTSLAREAALWNEIHPRRKSNYHAARHLAEQCTAAAHTIAGHAAPVEVVAAMRDLRALLDRTRQAATRSPSDASVLHCRRAALHAALRSAVHGACDSRQGTATIPELPAVAAALDDMTSPEEVAPLDDVVAPLDDVSLLVEERIWVEAQLTRSPWHEVLWHHRRWLLCLPGCMAAPLDSAERGPAFRPAESTPADFLPPGSEELAFATRHASTTQREASARNSLLHAEWCAQWRKAPVPLSPLG